MKKDNRLIAPDELLNTWSRISLNACHKYKFKEHVALITLLFYQFCYLQELSDEQRKERRIITSYYEDNIHLNVAIVSGKSDKHAVFIKRFLFKKEIYDKIDKEYGQSSSFVIDDKMVYLFEKLYQEEKNETSTQIDMKEVGNRWLISESK